jgi:hypothetical protein
MKKLFQVSDSGEMIRSFPTARTVTSLMPSGSRISAGSLTAWVRLLVNTVLVVIGSSFAMYIAQVYSNHFRASSVVLQHLIPDGL